MILLHCWSTECAPSWRRSLCLLLSRPRAGRYRQPPATRHTVRLEHETLDIKIEWLHHLHTNVLICFFYNLLIVFLISPPVRSSCSTSTTLWNLYYYYLSCVFSSSSLHSAVTFWCYSLLPCCLPLSISYFPGDGEVVLSLAAGSDDQVTLVQGLHHLLRLVETDIVEVGVGDHTLYICWREKGERKEQANIIRTVTWK